MDVFKINDDDDDDDEWKKITIENELLELS